MHRIIPLLLVLCAPAQAQNYPYGNPDIKCNNPVNDDSWWLEPHPTNQGEYLFSYINNIAECSDFFESIGVTAPDGFRVIMRVEVSVNDNNDERITIWPEDPQYMAYPPELVLPDSSEPGTIRLIPGVS